eukprot:10841478-Ditylum_brightwellii.AAC.1
MSVAANLQKHYKRSDAEKGSNFDLPAILFIPKATMLKMDYAQDFDLCVMLGNKQSMYKFKTYTFFK